MKIQKDNGIIISEKVLKFLKKELNHYGNKKSNKSFSVVVGVFTNCRESGYTYRVWAKDGRVFTFCTYEHRNSDDIIINGKIGYISHNGDLPYAEGTKWDYLKSFDCGKELECAKYLAKLIKEFNEL